MALIQQKLMRRTLENLTVTKTASECDSGPKLGLLYLDRRRKLDQ